MLLTKQPALREHYSGLLYTLGKVFSLRGKYRDAKACFREGLVLARELRQDLRMCQMLNGLAVLAGQCGQLKEAEAYLHEGLILVRRIQDSERIAIFLNNLGTAAMKRGKYQQAENYLQESLAHPLSAHCSIWRGAAFTRLGDVAMRRGEFELGHTRLDEALAVLRQVGDTNARLPEALYSKGRLALIEEKEQEAEEVIQEGIKLTRSAGLNPMYIDHLLLLAQIEGNRKNYARACELLREAQSLTNQPEPFEEQLCLSLAWGEFYLNSGSPLSALHQFAHTGRQINPEWRELLTQVLYGEARAALALGDLPMAVQRGKAALGVSQEIGHYQADEVEKWLREAQRT